MPLNLIDHGNHSITYLELWLGEWDEALKDLPASERVCTPDTNPTIVTKCYTGSRKLWDFSIHRAPGLAMRYN